MEEKELDKRVVLNLEKQKTNVSESNGAELEDVVQIHHACGIQLDRSKYKKFSISR